MQAVILAAGKGSRLHPLTTTRSKAMLPILGKPLVERVIEQLAENGVSEFILVVSPDDRDITRYFRRESQLDVDIRFVYQAQRLGMANALSCAVPLLHGNFMLSACDNLTSVNHIGQMLETWAADPRTNAVLTLMPVKPEQVRSAGIVVVEGEWITRIVEKPAPEEAPSNIASLPLYCFSPKILDYLGGVPLSRRGEYELQDAIQMLIDRDGCVRGVTLESRLTVTNAADLLAINRHYLIAGGAARPQIQPHTVGPNTRLITPLHIESGVVIGADCTIGPNVYIERDCQIGRGVDVRDAVLLRGSTLPDGAKISGQVIA
jgi:NDP-sugar pyrophosphorylase family protein